MARDPSQVNNELVALVGEASGAPEAEVRAALAPLLPAEEKVLRRALRTGAEDLGPFGWADLGRGVELRVAQAREVSGYYQLQAERDALAAMVKAPKEEPVQPKPAVKVRAPERKPEPVRALVQREKVQREKAKPDTRTQAASKKPPKGAEGRAQDLLGLFSYHRDAPLVARALKLSLTELLQELDVLKIKRAAFRLTRGVDADMPAATSRPGAANPVRRRTKQDGAAPKEAARPSAKDLQQAQLKQLLGELGPRRTELAARLGGDGAPLSEAALLARFRGADLEREFSLRERDLLRALYKKHRGVETKVAADLRAAAPDVRRIAAARGLTRELDGMRSGFLRDARQKKWPQERILQVLDEAAELRELGLYEELLREVTARTGVIWKSLAGKPTALDLLAQKLRLERKDALRLQRLLDLR
ncbi:MAG TPA: hypothetical protein VH083_09200 [Myxococcales bacterium]|jgi:hypothetical protein|nr:hypothetical protein [Myxococcales bacterium]